MRRFIITENERNQILGLYKSKKLIIEQEVAGKVTYNQITTSDDKGFEFFTIKPNAGIRTVDSDFYKETLSSYKIVSSKIDKKDTKSLNIWNSILGKDGDQIFAANCIYYVQKRDWVEVVEFKSKISEDETNVEGDTKFYPGSEVSIPKDAKTDKYFVNNEWTLTEFAKNDILTNIINPLVNAKGSKEGCIDLIKVESSASRYRNTELAKDLSFLELSQKRNDAVKDFIYEQLKSKGFEKWCKGTENIIQVTKGENGDGSSGPNPPNPTPYIPKGQEKMQPQAGDESHRNDFGAPHSRPEDYDIYKYSRPIVRVAYNESIASSGTTITPQPVKDTKTIYQAIFKGNTGVIEVPGSKPGLDIDISKQKTPRMNIDMKSVSCPVFSK